MAFTQRKRYKNQQNRRGNVAPGSAAQIGRRTPINVTGVTFGSGSAVVTFDQAVILAGIPQYANNLDNMPTAAERTGLNEVTLTYSDMTSTSVTVPFEDPAVRNGAGGYVSPGTFSAD